MHQLLVILEQSHQHEEFDKSQRSSHLYRDEDTGAIVNCDNTAYDRYMNKVKRKKFDKEELNNMKKDIEEIKNLLKDFLNK